MPRKPKQSASPRLTGLALVGIGVFLLLLNGYSLWENDEFYPKALVFTPMALLLGVWLTIVGQPIDRQTGERALWSKVGAGVLTGFGLLLGIIAVWFVGC